jgi:cell division protein FtsB
VLTRRLAAREDGSVKEDQRRRGRRRSFVASRSRRRVARGTAALRWLGLAVVLAIAVAYVHPLRAYQHARATVAERRADVEALFDANRALEKRLARTNADEFIEREARRLGLVKPGERLFIIKGVGKRKEARVR